MECGMKNIAFLFFILLNVTIGFSEESIIDSFYYNPFQKSEEYLPEIKIPSIEYIIQKLGKPDKLITDEVAFSNSAGEYFPCITLVYKKYKLIYVKLFKDYIRYDLEITNNLINLRYGILIGMTIDEVIAIFGTLNNFQKLETRNETVIVYITSKEIYHHLYFTFRNNALVSVRIFGQID
jgi:hypothetical protein